MPSPSGIFRDLYTVAELQAMLRELATTGLITSLSGAAKSGSYARLDPMQMAIELRAELNRLGGSTSPPHRVEQRLFEGGGMYPAT